MNQRRLVLVGLVFALGGPAALVAQKEWQLRFGRQVFLALAPVDPRSLMQGDYMRLDYAAARAAARVASSESDGQVVLSLDAQSRASFVRFDDGRPLGADEVRLRYRRRGGVLKLGTDAYYFQEGEAAIYRRAKYGEVRVTNGGDAVLVGLRDGELNALGHGAGGRLE